MWADDYHDNYVKPDNEEELDELLNPISIFIFGKNKEIYDRMCADIRKCIEIFGYGNVSIYNDEKMERGEHFDEFLNGFWINLRDGKYNDGTIEFENATILIEDGFMWVQH